MKTKEIEVWVNNSNNFDCNLKGTSIHWSEEEALDFREKEDILYKATLVIELPAPKKEFTEKELRGIINEGITAYRTGNDTQVVIANRIGLEVFGDK
jgi:hypothetical protein